MFGGLWLTGTLSKWFVIANLARVYEIDHLRTALLHLWSWPDGPWKRIHADFTGPVFGSDAHSKWMEVIPMSTTTEKTLEVLCNLFASYAGLPKQLVSDNGPQFTSSEKVLPIIQHQMEKPRDLCRPLSTPWKQQRMIPDLWTRSWQGFCWQIGILLMLQLEFHSLSCLRNVP